MYQKASTHIDKNKLKKGNLIFMSESGSEKATHIAIFDKQENGNIYFIDSTQKTDIDGVTHRYYNENDDRFQAFGIMRLKY